MHKSHSPCKNYAIIIEKYDWNCHKCTVFDRHKMIVELLSTASQFWHCWIVKDNCPYLVCNEDPQGYTVVNLKAQSIHPYVDTSGWGLTWKTVKPSPDGKWLAVQGDYMETTSEIAIFEFSTDVPMRAVKRVPDQGVVLKGWDNDKIILENHSCCRG